MRRLVFLKKLFMFVFSSLLYSYVFVCVYSTLLDL